LSGKGSQSDIEGIPENQWCQRTKYSFYWLCSFAS